MNALATNDPLAVVATAPFVSVPGHPVMAVEAKAVPLMVSVILLVPRDVAAATFTWPNEDAENIESNRNRGRLLRLRQRGVEAEHR